MRTRAIAVAAVAAISLLAACGSDSKGAADTTAPGTDSTTADTSTDSTTGDTSVQASGEHADEEFCRFQEDLNNSGSPLNSETATPTEIEQFFTETVEPAIAKLTDTAPDEMADDAATMADAYGKLRDLFEKNSWDLQKAIADPDLQTLATDAGFSTAASNIDEYCGFSATG